MVEESRDLFAGQLERAQLEEEAVGGGHDPARSDAADTAAHSALPGRFLEQETK